VLASSVAIEEAGSRAYQSDHMDKLFEEGFSFSGFERDKLYLSRHGEGFTDISGLSGLDSVTDGRGAAYGDLDNDGDLDIFLTALQGQVHHLFRNNVGTDNGFLRVALQGTESGRDAFGAVVRVKTTQGILTKVKSGGSGFVSQSDPRLLFGLGSDVQAEWVRVTWPSGREQQLGPVVAGSSLHLVEGGQPRYLDERRFSLPDPAAADRLMLQHLAFGEGDPLPAIPLTDARGGRTDFSQLRVQGRRYLVNLWATWCGPCKEEMPQLERLYPDLRAAGVELIGISLDTGSGRDRAVQVAQRLGATYPIYTTEESAFELLFAGDQLFVPVTLIVDERGLVADVFSGWSPQTESKLRQLID
jgi:thiol-disulfide isomerase/thioredoxin